MQESFAAYVVKKNDDRVEGEVTTLRADQLPAGDITIAVIIPRLITKTPWRQQGRVVSSETTRTCPALTLLEPSSRASLRRSL